MKFSLTVNHFNSATIKTDEITLMCRNLMSLRRVMEDRNYYSKSAHRKRTIEVKQAASEKMLSSADKEQVKTDPVNDALHTGGHQWLRHFGIGEPRTEKANKASSSARVTSLGSLEAEVMGLLWEIGRPANGMDVAEVSLYKRRSQDQEPIAFSTINTTLRRLTEKGLLVSQKGDTRTVYYTPTVGREEMAARILNNVSETLLGHSLHGLIPKLLGGLQPRASSSSSATESDEIIRLMQAIEEVAQPPYVQSLTEKANMHHDLEP